MEKLKEKWYCAVARDITAGEYLMCGSVSRSKSSVQAHINSEDHQRMCFVHGVSITRIVSITVAEDRTVEKMEKDEKE